MESVNAENTGRDLVVDVAQNSASLHISEEIYVRILGKALTQTTQDLTDLEAARQGTCSKARRVSRLADH